MKIQFENVDEFMSVIEIPKFFITFFGNFLK